MVPGGYGTGLARALEKLVRVHAALPPSQELTLLQMGNVHGRWFPGALITQLSRTDQGHEFYARATVAVPQSIHSGLMLQLFDSETWQPIGKLAVADEWLKNHHSIGAYGSSASGNVAAVFTYLYLDRTATPIAQVLFKTIGKVVDPTFSGLQPCKSAACSVGRVTSDEQYKICQDRYDTDCDVILPAGSTPVVPLAGKMENLPDALASPWEPGVVPIILLSSDGSCQYPSGTLRFQSQSPTAFSWTGNIAFDGTCLNTNPHDGVRSGTFDLSFGFPVKLRDITLDISVNSYDGNPSSPCKPSNNGTACIHPLTLVWGCLAAGTPVRMADGSVKRIEDVEVQEQVQADPGGRLLTVIDTLVGIEEEPLVAITDNRGHYLAMTKTHPVKPPAAWCRRTT